MHACLTLAYIVIAHSQKEVSYFVWIADSMTELHFSSHMLATKYVPLLLLSSDMCASFEITTIISMGLILPDPVGRV